MSERKTKDTRLGGVFFVPLLIVLALVALAVVALLPVVSATPQAFPDIVLELVASFGYTNKSGELSLFWGCLAGAALLLAAAGVLLARRGRRAVAPANAIRGEAHPAARIRRAGRALAVTVLPNAVLFVLMGRLSLPLLLLAALYLAVLALAPAQAERAALLAVCAYYALCGLAAAAGWLGFLPGGVLSGVVLLAATGAVTVLGLVFCLTRNRTIILNRIILVVQCAAPLVMCLFMLDRYAYQGGTLRLAFPAAWYVIIGLATAGLLVWAVLGAKARWNEPGADWQRLILTPTLIAVFVFNSYILPARFFQTDAHHHGEQMLPWQQIITEGQGAYTEYYPASGLFPMVIGFFQNVLLGGATMAYPAALSLTTALLAGLTIWLCQRYAGPALALGVAVLFSVPVYDRQYLVLPALLLLALPGLIEKRWLWLPAWVLCCLAAGLYYPVYGAALLVGTLPFGVVQCVAFFKTGEAKARLRRAKTWLVWAACLAPVALCLPLLWRMAQHTLLFSSNSVLADGISLFGAPVNEEFLPWLTAVPGVRLGLFYGFKYAVPILGVLLFVYCTALYLAGKTGATLWEKLQHPAFFAFSCGAGVLAVSYTFTTVRADYFTVFSRSGPILTAVAGIFFLAALRNYGHLILKSGARWVLAGLVLGLTVYLYNNCYMMNFPAPVGTAHASGGAGAVVDVDNDAKKLVAAYAVPEEYTRVTEENAARFPRLGDGFIAGAQQDELEQLQAQVGGYIDDGFTIANLGGTSKQIYYYPLGAKAAYNGAWALFKDAAVQNDVIRWLEEHPNTVGYEITPFTRYVLYHYLAAERACAILDETLWVFPEVAAEMGWEGRLDDTAYPFYANYVVQMDLGNYAGSLGKSMDTLAPHFTEVDTVAVTGESSRVLGGPGDRLEFELAAPLKGLDADYLYLELEAGIDLAGDPAQGRLMNWLTPGRKGDDYRVTVYWASEADPDYADARSFVCNYVDGRLLIALGSNPAWLYEDNVRFAVEFGDGFAAGDTVAIRDIQFMRYDLS